MAGEEDSPVAVAAEEEGEDDDTLDFLLEEESPARKASKKTNLEVNFELVFDYYFG